MSQRPLGAQISHMLKSRGVEVIFGIPGVHNQEMYRGIEEAGLTHILARHEQGAGFMADGYARATGKPGVAYVITGPGLCNIMTPMGQAYSDSVPLLVLASCLDETVATRGQLHQMKDQEGAARTVCDWSETARTADAAYVLVDRAFMEFETQRRRPKAIHVPIQQLEALADPALPIRQPKGAGDDGVPPHEDVLLRRINPHDTDDIVRRIMQADYPLFILGGGIAIDLMQGPVMRMLERFKAAAFMTYAGRGLVDFDYPLSFGATLARPESAAIIAKSDCVVVIGSDLSEVDLWRTDAGIAPGDGIHINTDPEVLARAHPLDIKAQIDGVDFLFFATLSNSDAGKAKWTSTEVTDFHTRMRAEIASERPGILPVADALKDALPPETMIYSDMTQFAYAALEVWPMDRPGHWHHPSGFGTLGYALPAAIGGKIGLGDQPVVAIAGDYGFQYSLQELMVAVELELTLPIIIWDNGKLGEIEDSMVAAQIAPNAVIQKNPDFVALAKAYGAAACAPQTLAELKSDVQKALATKGPTLIYLTSAIAEN